MPSAILTREDGGILQFGRAKAVFRTDIGRKNFRRKFLSALWLSKAKSKAIEPAASTGNPQSAPARFGEPRTTGVSIYITNVIQTCCGRNARRVTGLVAFAKNERSGSDTGRRRLRIASQFLRWFKCVHAYMKTGTGNACPCFHLSGWTQSPKTPYFTGIFFSRCATGVQRTQSLPYSTLLIPQP